MQKKLSLALLAGILGLPGMICAGGTGSRSARAASGRESASFEDALKKLEVQKQERSRARLERAHLDSDLNSDGRTPIERGVGVITRYPIPLSIGGVLSPKEIEAVAKDLGAVASAASAVADKSPRETDVKKKKYSCRRPCSDRRVAAIASGAIVGMHAGGAAPSVVGVVGAVLGAVAADGCKNYCERNEAARSRDRMLQIESLRCTKLALIRALAGTRRPEGLQDLQTMAPDLDLRSVRTAAQEMEYWRLRIEYYRISCEMTRLSYCPVHDEDLSICREIPRRALFCGTFDSYNQSIADASRRFAHCKAAHDELKRRVSMAAPGEMAAASAPDTLMEFDPRLAEYRWTSRGGTGES